MTTYHVSGNLYFKSANATQATTLYNAVVARTNVSGASFTYFRKPANTYVKTTLPDGTVRVEFYTCFTTATHRDYVKNLLTTTQINRLNLNYCSYLEIHTCAQDTPAVTPTTTFGIANYTLTQWGACNK